MATTLIKIGLPVVALLAVLFQVYLKEPIWLGFGIGRVMQPITDFPYTCRKIADPRMQACEDMWLSPSTRQLYLACSDSFARKDWFPHVGAFNISGRSQRDSIVALDIDKPVDNSFQLRTLKTPGFSGTSGDGLLNLAGFTGMENSDGNVELFLVNMRPSTDGEGNLLDQKVSGGNTTIEHFVTDGETEMKHVRTYADQGITSPNRVAVLDDKTFYITNDHGPHKLGWRHHMSMILAYANINYCSPTGCKEVSSNLKFPNGLARKDDILYVPDSMTGRLYIYRILPNKDLEKIDELNLGYGLDNASIDENGDIWVTAFPVGVAILKANDDPIGAKVPAAVLRVRKTEEGYVVDKIIEDQGETLPATTTVVHDTKTGRLFFSSVVSPWIAVCEPKA
ncbi:hypothetical protein F53441_7698 [Fusarium austroafricanum]|uniref:SMP-30/Gluconolactonase/LRE-like region domain-containing protein n=1 Tax=Fusarium austroafricanum TaxID=2364996 RepID=A0A8H4KG66_9HYPO|nr:hypothetical protein F53441_7698 [Fusarium austroafricanum]